MDEIKPIARKVDLTLHRGRMTNIIPGAPNQAVLPSAYHGYGNASKELPPLLKLPKDVLNLIVEKLVKQKVSLIPLRFVCKRIANLPGVQAEKPTNPAQVRNRVRDAAENALSEGSIPVVAWYHDRLHYPLTAESCAIAARSGNLATLQWLREKECPWDANTCLQAAREGHLGILQWAFAKGCDLNSRMTCANAAQGGHLNVLQWAYANGGAWDTWTCEGAARGGHLEVLQWARTNGCPWNDMTCTYAAKGGHLKILQWAQANGCPWDEMTCEEAARGGHLEVLQWARANGCPWDAETWRNAHDSVKSWLRENGCPQGPNRLYLRRSPHTLQRFLILY